MKELNLYVYGFIENAQVADANDYGVVSLKCIVDQINSNPDAKKLIVHIHSQGGDVTEGFAIHDFLVNTGKEVETVIEGMCASIATVVALAGSKRKMTKNSEFMIHNPWSFGVGTADDLHSQAEVVRAAEEKILNFYVEKTGGDKEAIKALMDEETFMASDKAKELGFITEVLDDSKNLVYAKINYKKQPMKKETKDSLIAKFNNVVAALKTELGIKAEVIAVKALDLKLKDSDDTIHIDTEADTAKVGDKVTKGGADVPNETFNLDGGKVLKTDDASLVLSIEDEAAPEEPNAKLVALEQENASLKNEIENLKNSQKESEDFATEIMAKLETLSSQVKSNFTPEQRVQNNGRFNADKSKDKDISDAVEKAKEKIKLRNQQRREGRVK